MLIAKESLIKKLSQLQGDSKTISRCIDIIKNMPEAYPKIYIVRDKHE